MAPNSDDFLSGEATKEARGHHGLGDLILTEILCRLPSTNNVFLCKCVSKHWKSLISDQYFIRQFIDHHRKNYGTDFNSDQLRMFINYCSKGVGEDAVLVASLGDEGPKQLSAMSSWPGDEGIKHCSNHQVESSFNDLLLVTSEMGSLTTYHIVNPFTKEHVELPLCDSLSAYPGVGSYGFNSVGFVCEPFYAQGEGRNLDLNPNYLYRVVRIMHKDFGSCSIATYCSETKQWSVLTGLDYKKYECHSNVVAHGRKLYWYTMIENIAVYDPFVATSERQFSFLGFDRAPRSEWSEWGDCPLVESQGSLLMMHLTKEGQGRYVSIWKLKEGDGHGDDEVFCFERSVMIDPITPPPISICPKVEDSMFLRILSNHPSNHDVIFLPYYDSPRIASYNLRTKEWRVVEEIEGTVDLDFHFHFHIHGVPAALPWWPTPIH